MNGHVIFIILVSAICTFFLRALPFVVFTEQRQMPQWLKKLGEVLPSAIMAVLIIYCLKGIKSDFFHDGISLIVATLVTGISYKLKHSTFLSIVLGTASYMILLRIV